MGDLSRHARRVVNVSHDLVAGYGESVISPPPGVELCGYGFYRGRRAESILDDLKARAVCISDRDTTLILIACDLLGFDVETSDAIRKMIADEHHLPGKNVLLACTHTHSGPATMSVRGCGEISPEYVRCLPELILEAARRAALDRSPCEMRTGSEQSEPIGFNRRLKSFHPIDPAVSAVILRRKEFPICIFAYSCHAVTLGPNPAVSADWPGATVKAMERDGYRCVCFQGFCGDIDPVCHLNQWGSGTPDELALYGLILKRRLLNIARKAQPGKTPSLTAVEKRISLPLEVPPDRKSLDKECEAMLSKKSSETFKRFATAWRQKADEEFEKLHRHPFCDNVPIQAMRLDTMNLIALPGEIFCEYGLKLRPQFSPLLTIGYANGNTGYWPVKTAYAKTDDYAAYLAPKAYNVFPFASSLEDIVFKVCLEMLTEIQAGKPA